MSFAGFCFVVGIWRDNGVSCPQGQFPYSGRRATRAWPQQRQWKAQIGNLELQKARSQGWNPFLTPLPWKMGPQEFSKFPGKWGQGSFSDSCTCFSLTLQSHFLTHSLIPRNSSTLWLKINKNQTEKKASLRQAAAWKGSCLQLKFGEVKNCCGEGHWKAPVKH